MESKYALKRRGSTARPYGFNRERSCCGTDGRGIANTVSAIREAGVLQCFTNYRNILLGRLLVEAVRQQAVVLDVAYSRQESGGDMTVLITKDGFIDLDLIRAAYFRIVRLETRGVGVVVVANNRAIGVKRAGFEDCAAITVADDEVEPYPPRWVRGGEFVTILVSNNYVGAEAA